jgi:hypothetical protein
MRNLFLVVAPMSAMLVGLLGCGNSSSDMRSPNAPLPSTPSEKIEQIEEEPQALNLPPSNTPEKNVFSLQLEASDKDREALVPYHYTTDSRTKMLVKEPLLTGVNCSRPPEISKLEVGFGKSSTSIPMFAWAKGWVKGKDASAGMGYGIEEDTSPNRQETIVIVLAIPSGCTQVNGEFDVQLR